MFFRPESRIRPNFRNRFRMFLTLTVAMIFLAGASVSANMDSKGMKMKEKGGMGGMADMAPAPSDVPRFPAVKGYTEGQVIYFIHTEISDAGVGKILTDMMGGSPVLVVPDLANTPDHLLANLFAFKNGLQQGDGPFGFTADVLDHPPGSPGYRPMRRISLVTWKNESAARLLKSMQELRAAESAGELEIQTTDIVVNLPFLTWPGGKR